MDALTFSVDEVWFLVLLGFILGVLITFPTIKDEDNDEI